MRSTLSPWKGLLDLQYTQRSHGHPDEMQILAQSFTVMVWEPSSQGLKWLGGSLGAHTDLEQWLSTLGSPPLWWLDEPFTAVTYKISFLSDTYIMIHSSSKISYETAIWGTVLKGHSIRKVENHCPRSYKNKPQPFSHDVLAKKWGHAAQTFRPQRVLCANIPVSGSVDLWECHQLLIFLWPFHVSCLCF